MGTYKDSSSIVYPKDWLICDSRIPSLWESSNCMACILKII